MQIRLFIFILLFIIGVAGPLRAESFFISPFINDGDRDADWVGAGFLENVSNSLQAAGCPVISPGDVRIACGYLGVYDETAVSRDNLRKVADVLNVDRLVSAHYKMSSGRISITAELFSRGEAKARIIAFEDSAENIFFMQEFLSSAIRKSQPVGYVPPKPVYVTVWKKKKKYTYKQENPYIRPYEWYSRGLALRKKKPAESMNYLIQTLRYDPEHVRALSVAADIAHNEQGLSDGALGFLLRADKILVRRGESSFPSYAFLMVRIADIYEDKKDKVRAQLYLSRALEVWKKNRKGRADDYAAFLYDVAGIYAGIGAVNTELDYLSMAQEAVEKDGNTHSVRYAWLMKHMGELYVSHQSRAAAEPYFIKAEAVLKERGLDGTADYADCKYQRAVLYAEQNEKVKAEAEFRNACRIYTDTWQYEKARAALKEADLLSQTADVH
jgi:tetratricopeptide (TPR) repeat protein